VVTEDPVFMLEWVGFSTSIDLPKFLEARALLHEGLPAEPLAGQLPKAGIPKTFRKAT
jgi:hydroxymethylglutaryl-CoA lyase